MEKGYTSKRGGGFGRLFNIIGFLSALVLAIGLVEKHGLPVDLGDGAGYISDDPIARAGLSEPERSDEEVVFLDPEPEQRSSRSAQSYRPQASRTPARMKAGDWVEKFSETAVMQALNRGVPAGISLAVGVLKLQSGANISSWDDFMREVIEPLSGAKHQDGMNGYFKYSANSERWVQGLDRLGLYSARTLRSVLERYRLEDFDGIVRHKLAAGPAVDPVVERKARQVAEEVTHAIRERRGSYEDRTAEATEDRVSDRTQVEDWEALYDEVVGQEVARDIARQKLKSGQYISEEDMARLVEETNSETSEVLKNNLGFTGRRINPDHPEANELLDITDPRNAQAREEVYQRELEKRGLKKPKFRD